MPADSMEAPTQPLQVEEYGVPAGAEASLEPPANHLELAQQMALAAQGGNALLCGMLAPASFVIRTVQCKT